LDETEPARRTHEERMLIVDKLTKTYNTPQGRLTVLREVDLSLQAGETVALTGESGSGKSTLLHLIAGLDVPDSGEIRLNGENIPALSDSGRAAIRREKLGLVFQQFNLIPSLTVASNLAFQARIAGRYNATWLNHLTDRLGLGGLTERYPEQLSVGQQQRVAIGRTLAAKPLMLLADEPTGNLDEATGDEVLELSLDLVAQTGCGFLMVTHSARLAAMLDRRLTLSNGRLL
jgi:putative ABC transport system ATP-binding protein